MDSFLSSMFREQYPRSLYDVDKLMYYRELLRTRIGLEKAKKIEDQPDLYYDWEKLRIW